MNMDRDTRAFLRVYLIADPDQTTGDFLPAVERALSGGATAVQFRSKLLDDGPFLTLAQRVKSACDLHAVPFIVNDRVDVALALGADGVHVGVDDLPIPAVRGVIGVQAIIGYSPASEDQTAAAKSLGADYVGLGPVFSTGSKDDAGEAIGLDAVRRRASLAQLPVVGIGGIDADNAPDVIAAGADGVAVISAILRSENPRSSAAGLLGAVDRALERRAGGG